MEARTKSDLVFVPRSGSAVSAQGCRVARLPWVREPKRYPTPTGLWGLWEACWGSRLLIDSFDVRGPNPVGVGDLPLHYPRVAAQRGNPGLKLRYRFAVKITVGLT